MVLVLSYSGENANLYFQHKKMKRKRKRLIDQVYNGAFEGLELTKSSKNALINSGLLIIASLWIANNIKKQ